MKPNSLKFGNAVLVVAMMIVAIGLVSWDQRNTGRQFGHITNDTTPRKNVNRDRDKVRDLDDVIDRLDRADLEINQEKLKAQLEEVMKGVDMEKIQKQMKEAMASVDMDKVRAELERSMAKIDMEKVKSQMELAMKEVDLVKMQEELKNSINKVDWDKMKTDLDKVKEIDMKDMEKNMEKMKEQLKQIGPDLEKQMEKVKVDMEKAKAEMKEYKEFVDGLEKDGLINKKENYSIRNKNGELQINGKKAEPAVYDKYRNFLEKHKQFRIEKSGDDFDINLGSRVEI